METDTPHIITKEINIQLVTPVYFLATKLEAYRGRGNDDVLGRRDVEDILHLVGGRTQLIRTLHAAEPGVQAYTASEISARLG